MTPETAAPRSPLRGLAVAGALLSWLVIAGSAALLLQPPEVVVPEVRRVVDMGAAQPNGGFAYVVEVDVDEPSDSEGSSRLRLLEDGVELTAHAGHKLIRDQGEGRFSHWGHHLYLSATDGSDPRENGRTYELVLPLDVETLQRREVQARSGILVGGAAALLLCLLWRGSRGAQLGRLGLTLALVAAAHVVTRGDPLAREAPHLSGMATALLERGGPDGGVAAMAPGDGPRSVRLLDGEHELVFAPDGAVPVPRDPLQVPLAPAADVELRDGLALLEVGQMLASADGLDIPGSTLAELVMEYRAIQGDEVRFHFHDDRSGADANQAQLIVPIQPDGEWHTLRIARPLSKDQVALWLTRSRNTIQRIELGPTPHAPQALRIEVKPLLLSDSMAVYTRSSHGRDTLEIERVLRPAVWQSAAGRFELPWPDGDGTRLRGAVAALAAERDVPAPYSVAAVFADGSEQPLASGSVASGQPWSLLDVDLATLGGRRPTSLAVGAPELTPESVLAWTGLRRIDTRRPARRVVLLLIDTLRADALSSYGHPTNRTPALDGLAAEGARFERCYSQAFWTRPSVPSIMSSRYVRGTGVHSAGLYLPDSYDTLAEHFAAAGFFAVGFVTNAHAGPAAGLLQGLDEMVLETHVDATERLLQDFVEPRLDTLADEDLFAWVHLMEVHGPYGPVDRPEGFVEQPGTPVPWDDRYDRKWNPNPTAESRRAFYDSDLELTDAALGRWLQTRIAAWDAEPGPDTIVAVAADHGEFLGEYDGTWGHEWYRMLPETVHVPLIVRAPGAMPAHTVWPHPVENIDLGPTLLDLAGVRPWQAQLERPDHGRSLLPLVTGAESGDGHLALSAYDRGNGRGALSVWTDSGGLIAQSGRLVGLLEKGSRVMDGWDATPMRRLADVSADLEEPFDALWDAYLESQEALRAARWAQQAGSPEQQLAGEALEQMRALGYLGR